LAHDAISHLDVVNNMKESITSLESDSVHRRLGTLATAVDQLQVDVQVRHRCLPAERNVFFIYILTKDENKLSC